MNDELFRVYAHENWARDVIELHFHKPQENGNILVIKSITTGSVPEITWPDDEPIVVSKEAAQILIDQLWNMGMRPQNARNVNEIVNAKDGHIRDLEKVLDAFIRVTHKEG